MSIAVTGKVAPLKPIARQSPSRSGTFPAVWLKLTILSRDRQRSGAVRAVPARGHRAALIHRSVGSNLRLARSCSPTNDSGDPMTRLRKQLPALLGSGELRFGGFKGPVTYEVLGEPSSLRL